MSWTPKRLDRLGTVSRGRSRHRPRDAAHLYGGPYPFIQTGDVKRAALYVTEHTQTYSEAGLEQSRLWPAGTLCITIAANIADTAILTYDACFPDIVIGFIPDPGKADATFIKYFFDARLKGSYRQFSQGAAQDNLSQEKLLSIDLVIPDDVEEQRAIAVQLSTIDNLIENNRRRIKLLEESARLLYREWFVHLRFPGHEHVKAVDGVPEGWELCSAFDAMDVMSGGTPKTNVADYWRGDIPFFTPKDAVDAPYVFDTEKHLTDRGLAACNSQLYPKDTIFITARGTVGNLNLAQAPIAMNQSCYALKGKGYLSQIFVFSALKEAVQQFKSRAGGAVFDAIVVNTFKLIPFMRPPQELVREYTDTVDPMFRQIDRLLLQSAKLREARDLLLPRLMSGEPAVW